MNCNYQSTIKLAKNLVFHTRTKYIEVHHHLVQESVLRGEIKLDHIFTVFQPVDIFTKSLPQKKFE
jgi:hypothetical protein